MRPDDGQGSPFHRLRGIFLEILNLVPGLSDKRRRIAMTLAFRAHQETFARTGELVSWIGATTLAVALGYDRRTIQRGLKKLLEEGVIEVDRKGGGRARSTRYRFSKQWLHAAVDQAEKSGRAEAYGLPADLFAWACGGTIAAQLAQFGGNGAADQAGMGGRADVVSPGMGGGMAAAAGNSGTGVAVYGQNSGANPGGDRETAANHAGNSGNLTGNSGKAVPPETDLNYRNKNPHADQRAAPGPDRNQGHFNYLFRGGRASETPESDPVSSVRNANWYPKVLNRAVGLIGDQNRAVLAVDWLEESQKRQLSEGYKPNDSDLERWLTWALQAADSAVAPGNVAPGQDSGDRLTRLEREVEGIGRSVAALVAALQPLLPAAPEQSAA